MIVGFRNPDVHFKFPKSLNIPTKLGNILEPNPDDKYTISDKLWESHQIRKERNRAKGNGFGYCLFNNESKYTSTISARYYKDGSEILIEQKGKNPRKLTPREASRLQGYPEDYKIVVSDTQAYRQFGNSVPVKMIKAVAEKMYEALKESEEIV
jgi:DNA (cytosine-5)-methyltransferase 1